MKPTVCRWGLRVGLTLAAGLFVRTGQAQSLPSDVRAGHWAAASVQSALRNHLLSLEADKGFHGDARVNHTQAILALAKLAHSLEDGNWQTAKPIALAVAKTGVAPKAGTWEGQNVSRYIFANVLTKLADYTMAGMERPKPGEKEFGKSIALPDPVHPTVPKSNPAYAALNYLAERRMVLPGSPLLTADDKPLKAAELSRVLHDLITGLNDHLTDLGHDENGATRDEPFHKPPAQKKN